MRGLWPFARRSLLGRRGRTALLVSAVALAASLVVAVTSGMRTAQASLEDSISKAMGATDARIVHLHGLNLSRAWCWQALLPGLPGELAGPVLRAIDVHRQASLAAALGGDYVATHWLASFVLLAEGRDRP